jgi:hypothetical protein
VGRAGTHFRQTRDVVKTESKSKWNANARTVEALKGRQAGVFVLRRALLGRVGWRAQVIRRDSNAGWSKQHEGDKMRERLHKGR